jgi:hypothetical protein
MNLEPTDGSSSRNPPRDSEGPPQAQRDQLLKKLSCLIAVLEAAIAKVRRNLSSGHPDPDRLERIRANLANTLAICLRAKVTLERRGTLPANLPPEVSEAVRGERLPLPRASAPVRRRGDRRMTYRDYVELTSFEEYRKFKDLPPITVDEITTCDLDELTGELGRNS